MVPSMEGGSSAMKIEGKVTMFELGLGGDCG